ncbi:MAG: hypothetical protein JXK05_06675 [Campylobacterales bacterium]|nr:hypothetical protein [Campylobacterales bacterium]
MRAAFSLLELIFVVVLIGTLTGLGVSALRQDYLLHDSHYIASKIMQAQYEAIGYDSRGLIGQSVGCLVLSKEGLEGNVSKNEERYALHVTDKDDKKDFNFGRLCFDHRGVPDFSNMAQNVLTLKYQGIERNITIAPMTGYVIINP